MYPSSWVKEKIGEWFFKRLKPLPTHQIGVALLCPCCKESLIITITGFHISKVSVSKRETSGLNITGIAFDEEHNVSS